MTSPAASGVRLAELVAALSLATDLGLGQPQEHLLRAAIVADRLGVAAELSDDERAAVYYVTLLGWVGCVADSHEMARWFADDTSIRAASFMVDRAGKSMMRFLIANVAPDASGLQRLAVRSRFMTGGFRDAMDSFTAHCQTTAQIADRLGLAEAVRLALPQSLERWDGKGGPAGLRGAQIERTMRVAVIAQEVEVIARLHGTAAAVEMLEERKGTQFDPELAALCAAQADRLLELDRADAWEAVIAGCAPLDRRMDEAELDAALETFADYADLKSPWFAGHSRAVAGLAAEAARRLGLPPADAQLVRRAGLVCRIGAIGVAAGVWDRAGPLTAIEWERVRTVPYLTERVLSRQPALARAGAVAGMLHERIDGSGYPRGVSGGAVPVTARVLAAAEVYQAAREPRPHRGARSRAETRRLLLDEAAGGRLDASAVDAVLAAAGHPSGRRAAHTGGLSAREIEVLRLLVRGLSNKQIAREMTVSVSTVGSHIEHIYTKIGANTRGSAAMYAMQHGLIDASLEDGPKPG
jgi:HD-GYP domain-containing protein (c-di-GMP phosphodiesterase class II)